MKCVEHFDVGYDVQVLSRKGIVKLETLSGFKTHNLRMCWRDIYTILNVLWAQVWQKGPSGIEIIIMWYTFWKHLKFQNFTCFYNDLKLLLTYDIIKAANVSYKIQW